MVLSTITGMHMSVKQVQKHIKSFLLTDKPEVMVIKGAWGVGKTFSWKIFLQENKNELKLPQYSYVSLFGISSLESLKYSLFESSITSGMIGSEPTLETAKQNAVGVIDKLSRKGFHWFMSAPVLKSFSSNFESLLFMSLQKTLIVIDDLERKGDGLKTRDVLGLISLLKEQRSCKVVLLLNEGSTGIEEYSSYKEKVIDIELLYDPTARECAAIAFDHNKKFYEHLSDCTTSLGIKNIRVLQRIERLVDITYPYLSGCEIELLNTTIHSLTLFCWSYYCFNGSSEIPSLDYIESLENVFIESEDDDELKKSWKKVILSYDYNLTNEYDAVLIDAVRTGYFNEAALISSIQFRNDEIKRNKAQHSLAAAWRKYNNSFAYTQKEVLDALNEAYYNNLDLININDVDNVVSLFEKLGENQKEIKMVDDFIKRNINRLPDLVSGGLRGYYHITNPYLDKKLKNYIDVNIVDKVSLEDILIKLSSQNGWSDNDIKVLSSASVNDYYNLFKSPKSDDLGVLIATSLRFGTYTNSSKEMKMIASNATEALQQLANESPINSLRVKMYKIN